MLGKKCAYYLLYLSDTQFVSQQRGNNVSITVVTNDEIRLALQLLRELMSNILSVAF